MLLRAVLPLALASAAPALAARSDWAPADQSQLRLLLAAGEGGHLSGGIEIALEPGWYTYWRNPGESGVPPSFDFSGSENVASVEVRYPAPERYDDGVSVSLIYRDAVVFPLAVTPIDPDRPVTLSVAAQFGVCSKVCIPTRAGSVVTLAPAAPADPLADALLQRYAPRVPGPPEPGRFDIESVTAEGDALLIDVRIPDMAYFDLFADPPPGWYVGQPSLVARDEGLARYRLSLDGRPEGAAAGQTFRFVAVAGGEAIEETIEIP
jgi:DsbC/DsbD-like thiol-disulfide interchange protein